MLAHLSPLADPTRRAIFERVALAPCAVGEIEKSLPVSLSAVSQHLKILREAGLVVDERRGRQRIYRVRPEMLEDAARHLDHLRASIPSSADADDSLDRQAARLVLPGYPDMEPNIIQASFRIQMVARLIAQNLAETASAVGVSSGELLVLDALRRQGPPFEGTPTQLKGATWITLAGLGKRLDRLESSGHVVRRPDPADGRGTVVRLTAKGLRTLERAVHVGSSSADFMALAEFPQGELSRLVELLRHLQHRIEELRRDRPA